MSEERQNYKSYTIQKHAVCKICGEDIHQVSASSCFEAMGKCGCGVVWEGHTILNGSAMIDKWRRVEK